MELSPWGMVDQVERVWSMVQNLGLPDSVKLGGGLPLPLPLLLLLLLELRVLAVAAAGVVERIDVREIEVTALPPPKNLPVTLKAVVPVVVEGVTRKQEALEEESRVKFL